MSISERLVVLILLPALTLTGQSRGKPTPRFEDYPANEKLVTASTVPAPPTEAPRIAAYWESIDFSPNFAGHYAIIDDSCGSGCQYFVVVDVKSGKVLPKAPFSPTLFPNIPSRIKHDRIWQGVLFRPDSRLVIVDGCAFGAWCGIRYYVIESDKFRLAASSPTTGVSVGPPPR